MYSGKINSPSTTLATPINNSDTTIVLVDASVLPAAPNIFVIGYDTDSPETIFYPSTPSLNVLSGVTRAFQGVAQSWIVNSKIARMFTEYDYNALVNNLSIIQNRSIISTVDFGTNNVETFTTNTLTGISWVTASSKITCSLYGENSGSRSVEDGFLEGIIVGISDITDGGFKINAYAPNGTSGVYKVICIGG
jgi:hypothetical protein